MSSTGRSQGLQPRPASALPPIRSWLYAPGNNPKLLDRVFSTGTDAAVLDLEDAVPPAEKERARGMVAETIRVRAGQPGPIVFARVNHPSTGLTEGDVQVVVATGLRGIRIPKVEDAATVQLVAGWLESAEAAAGLPAGSIGIVPGIESAAGIWRAHEIGAASPRVLALAFGTVDFIRDLNLAPESPDGREFLYYRSHLVLASRIAGVGAPIDNVHTRLADLDDLEREARASRAMGFFGKTCIHPKQVEVVNRIFTPTDEEIARARTIVDAAAEAEARGIGAIQLPDGDFVDIPVVRRAEATLALAKQLATE